MKKIARILLVVLLVLSLVGCGGSVKKDPKTILTEAAEKTAALECQEIEATVKMNLMGMEMEMPTTTRVILKDGQVQSMEAKAEAMGIETKVSYVDGTVYMEAMGMKLKATATAEESAKLTGTGSSADYNIEAEYIESVTEGEKDADGNATYTVTIKQDAVNEMMKDLAGELSGEGAETEISDFVYTATVNADGYISKIDISMVLKMKAEGMTMSCDTTITAEYKNPGEKFEITAPEDAADYMEYKISDLLAQ